MVSYTRETKKLNKILILGATVAIVATAMAANVTHGLTYSQDIGVSFTFNPVIGLTISASDLIISNLSPGTAADSNVIDINILTNNANGYTLNASVGNDSTYNTRNLVHTNNTVPNTFSSVDFGSSITSNTSLSDNTWAYSYSIDSGTTWTGYNGLPLYSDTTNIAQLKNSTTPVSSASGDAIKFKIAAKASTTQASGEYRNVINFQLTATPLPTTLSMAYANAGKEKHNGYFKLQDMNADICDATEVIGDGSVTGLIDVRDNTVYAATKLVDNKCWMIKNLELDFSNLREDISVENTNSPTVAFMAEAAMHPATTNPSTATPWCNTNSGNCVDQLLYSTVNLGNAAMDGYGVYYNWYTATAGNGTYGMNSGNVVGDLCPYGWRLPTGGYDGDIWDLHLILSDDLGDDEPLRQFFDNSGRIIDSSVDYRGHASYTWSSTAQNYNQADSLYISISGDYDIGGLEKYSGFTVRCVAR